MNSPIRKYWKWISKPHCRLNRSFINFFSITAFRWTERDAWLGNDHQPMSRNIWRLFVARFGHFRWRSKDVGRTCVNCLPLRSNCTFRWVIEEGCPAEYARHESDVGIEQIVSETWCEYTNVVNEVCVELKMPFGAWTASYWTPQRKKKCNMG